MKIYRALNNKFVVITNYSGFTVWYDMLENMVTDDRSSMLSIITDNAIKTLI